MQRDPQGYVDGMGLYEYVGCNPCVRYDSLGLYSWDEFTGDIKTVVSVGKEAVHTYAIFIVHGENPISAGVCTVEAGIVVGGAFTRGEAAYEAAKEAGVGDPEASRIGDAVRHATWQGETTKAFGEDIAKEMGDYHERGDETVDSRQDRENNKTARQIGKDAKNLDDIHERVKDSLGKGDLVTDFKDPRIAPAPVSEKESDSKPAEADKYNREKDLRNVKATAKRLDHNDRVSRRPPGLQR